MPPQGYDHDSRERTRDLAPGASSSDGIWQCHRCGLGWQWSRRTKCRKCHAARLDTPPTHDDGSVPTGHDADASGAALRDAVRAAMGDVRAELAELRAAVSPERRQAGQAAAAPAAGAAEQSASGGARLVPWQQPQAAAGSGAAAAEDPGWQGAGRKGKKRSRRVKSERDFEANDANGDAAMGSARPTATAEQLDK